MLRVIPMINLPMAIIHPYLFQQEVLQRRVVPVTPRQARLSRSESPVPLNTVGSRGLRRQTIGQDVEEMAGREETKGTRKTAIYLQSIIFVLMASGFWRDATLR